MANSNRKNRRMRKIAEAKTGKPAEYDIKKQPAEVRRAVFESVAGDDMPDGAYFALAEEFGLDAMDLVDDDE